MSQVSSHQRKKAAVAHRKARGGFEKDLADGKERERFFAELLLSASTHTLTVATGRGLKAAVENTFITWRPLSGGGHGPDFHAIEWDSDCWVVIPAWRVRSLGSQWEGKRQVIPLNRICDRPYKNGHAALLSGIDVPNPPSVQDRKKYDMALRPENVREGTFSQLLFKKRTEVLRIEHKFDDWAMTTGNIFVEYRCSGEPSGIARTTAHFYAVWWDRECWLVLPTERLKRIARRSLLQSQKQGGDTHRASGALVCLYHIFDPI